MENEVIPDFYNREQSGIPVRWVARIRESMARLTTHFSSNRAVCQYTEEYYLPAARAYRRRAADQGKAGLQIVEWKKTIERVWEKLRFGEMRIEEEGNTYRFELQIYLDGLGPDEVRAELYAEGMSDGSPEIQEMTRGPELVGAENGFLYRAGLTSTRPVGDYTARLIPRLEGVAVPLEEAHTFWQR